MVTRGMGSPACELAGARRNWGAGFPALLLLVAWAAFTAPGARAAVPPAQDPFYKYEGKTSLKHIAPGTVLKTRTVPFHIEGDRTAAHRRSAFVPLDERARQADRQRDLGAAAAGQSAHAERALLSILL